MDRTCIHHFTCEALWLMANTWGESSVNEWWWAISYCYSSIDINMMFPLSSFHSLQESHFRYSAFRSIHYFYNSSYTRDFKKNYVERVIIYINGTKTNFITEKKFASGRHQNIGWCPIHAFIIYVMHTHTSDLSRMFYAGVRESRRLNRGLGPWAPTGKIRGTTPFSVKKCMCR